MLAFSLAKLTVASLTPGTFFSSREIMFAQELQCIPWIDNFVVVILLFPRYCVNCAALNTHGTGYLICTWSFNCKWHSIHAFLDQDWSIINARYHNRAHTALAIFFGVDFQNIWLAGFNGKHTR